MPTLVDLPSRKLQLVFPDKMSEDEIRTYVKDKYPTTGEDVAYRVEQANQQSLEGAVTVNPFEGENKMSRDDYILLKKHQAEKKSSLGDILGVATDVAGTVFSDIGNAITETGAAALVGEFQPAMQSIGEGVAAGTVGLYDIANRILRPSVKIPSKEEFLKTQVPTGELEQRQDAGTGVVGSIPRSVMRPATEEDYKALIDREMQKDADAVNRLYLMEDIIRGAPIEEIARGASYLDATTIATLGASTLAKTGVKTLFKPAVRVGVSTAPGRIGQAALTAAEKTAGAVETVASLPRRAINVVGDVVESVAPGTGLPAKGATVAGATLSGAGVPLAGAAATEKVAEVVGATARAAMGEASRASPLERVAMNGAVSPAGRKLAAGLAQLQPIGTASYRIGKQAVKEGLAGSAVGAGLGYLAEGNLEGAAAGAGAGAAIGGFSGTLRSSFDLGREMVGLSTSRTRQQATGDINRFLGERPEVEQAAWAETMNRLVEQVGPERAAAQIDALRVAEANGATVRVATPDEIKQWKAPGWVESGKNELVLNPTRIIGDTAAHETSHVLFSSVLNRAFRSEIEQAIIGVTDPVTKEVIRPGIFDDAALARIADQISEAYGESNTGARDRFKGFAENLRNSIDQDKLGKVRIDIVDELVATYTGRMMDRSRPGRFNPDRLPLLYRRVLNSIDETVRNTFQTVLFEKGMDLRFDSATKSFKTDKGKTIRIPELDAIIKRAFAKPGSSAAKAAKAKPDLIPVNPADRAVWARSYGGAKGILNDDLTPKSKAQIDAEALARWQDKTKRLSALPDDQRIGIEFSKDKNGNTVLTARGQLSPEAMAIILDGATLDDTSQAVLRQVLNSWQDKDKATFDTRYYGVYDRGKGSNKMVAGVKSASQNEILPYSIEANSKDGIIIRAVDMTKVRERLTTALNKPQFKNLYKNPADALKDFKRYLENLTNPVAMESAMLLGGGEVGAKKRNLFYDTLGFRLRNGESLVNVPESTIAKSQNTIKSYRVERFAKLQESGFAFPFEEGTTYERVMKNFQPDAFTRETLPNGEAMTNPDGYRILKKTGSSLFRVYDREGKLLGVESSEVKAMSKAQGDFAKKTTKEEKQTRFQAESPDIRFQPSSLTARDIDTIAKEVGGGEVKGGAKKFGAFMREMRDKGITIRDVVKSYGITVSSINRRERPAQSIKKAWPDAPFKDGEDVRPEDAFATLLGTKEGQEYLNSAERGEFNEPAADAMMQKFRPFGLHNTLKKYLKNAAEEFFPKAQSIIDAVNNMPTEQFADFIPQNIKGVKHGKVGFFAGHLGRGDLPTFDSRMGNLVYGERVKVTKKVLMDQRDRLTQLGITVPDEYKDFAQTLLHHEVWDRLNNSDTEHSPIKESMLRFQPDDPNNTADAKAAQNTLKTTYFKNQEEFQKAVSEGRVKKANIEDFIGRVVALHQPDNAMVGTVEFNGNIVVVGQGGVYYAVKFGKDGSMWASTKSQSDKTAKALNEIHDANNGKIYLALTSAPVGKLHSATNMVTGTINILEELSNLSKEYGMTKSDLNSILTQASKVPAVKKKNGKVVSESRLKVNLDEKRSLNENLSLLREVLKPENSTFDNRTTLSIEIAKNLAAFFKDKPKESAKFASLILGDSNKYANANIKSGKLSKDAILQAFGDMYTEEFLKDFQSSQHAGHVYAIIEMDGRVESVHSPDHKSYPFTVKSTSGKKPVVHILDKAMHWRDVVGLAGQEGYVPEALKKSVYPSGGFSTTKHGHLEVKKPREGAVPTLTNIMFQPDPASPNILVGSNGTRIVKSPSGKFRIYSVTGTLLGIRESEQAAQKLASK